MKKNLNIIIAIIIVIVLGAVIWINKASTPTNNVENSSNPNPEQAMNITEDSATEDKSTMPSETVSPSSAVYTISEVGIHNNPTDCWAVVDNNIYNLTSWVAKHPGGEKAIIGLCGIDGTAQFAKVHGSNEKAKAALASFLIGSVSN